VQSPAILVNTEEHLEKIGTFESMARYGWCLISHLAG